MQQAGYRFRLCPKHWHKKKEDDFLNDVVVVVVLSASFVRSLVVRSYVMIHNSSCRTDARAKDFKRMDRAQYNNKDDTVNNHKKK